MWSGVLFGFGAFLGAFLAFLLVRNFRRIPHLVFVAIDRSIFGFFAASPWIKVPLCIGVPLGIWLLGYEETAVFIWMGIVAIILPMQIWRVVRVRIANRRVSSSQSQPIS